MSIPQLRYFLMLRLTLALIFIGLVTILFSQEHIELRLISAPVYNEGDYSSMQNIFQGSYDLRPQKGVLGFDFGIQLQHIRSKSNFFSCDCEPVFQNISFIHQDEVVGYSGEDYITSMTIGIFSRVVWNNKNSKKLRLIPSLALHLNDEILFNYHNDRFWSYKDGSSYDSPKTKRSLLNSGTNLGLYLTPTLQIDYLIIPKWNVRLGINSILSLYLTGEGNLEDKKMIIGGSLSKSLL